MDKAGKRLPHNDVMPDKDLVKHHYNRRGLVGPQAMLFRRTHPMSWKRVSGNYQTWELNVLAITPSDAESAHEEPVKTISPFGCRGAKKRCLISFATVMPTKCISSVGARWFSKPISATSKSASGRCC